MKRFYILIMTIMATQFMVAQTTLNPGEVRIVGFYSDANQGGEDCGDAFAFVSWVALDPGTEIRFSEEDISDWNPSDADDFGTEGELLWTNNTGSTIPALTRIDILTSEQGAGCGDSSPVANIGMAVYETTYLSTNASNPLSLTWQLNGSNEEIIAYQGSGPRNIATAISVFLSDRSISADNTPASLLGTDFALTFNDIDDDVDVAVYNGTTTFTDFNDFTTQLNNINGNWAFQNSGGGNDDGTDGVFPDYPDDLVFSASLSVSNFEANSFKAHPNPAIERVIIESSQRINSVIIYNSFGKIVYQNMSFEKEKNQINVSKLQTGIYFLRASMDGRTQTIKLIKQ